MKKRIILFLLILSLFIVTGCSKNSEGNSDIDEGISITNPTNRKIYYTLGYTITTKNLNEKIKEISSKVTELEGYISNSSEKIENNKNNDYAHYTYRVPTKKLQEFVDFMNNDDCVTNKTISSSDITTEYSETEERLKTLYASKAAYTKLLNEESLTISDIIVINNKLEDLDTEINVLESKKAKYDNLIDYSTININFYSVAKDDFFIEYGSYLLNFVVILFTILMYSLPFGVLAGIVLLVIFFFINKKNKRKSKLIK